MELLEGAEASLVHTSSGTRISKGNAPGVVQLKWSESFQLKKGQRVTFRVPYHTEDASIYNVLLVRPVPKGAAEVKLDAKLDGFAVWTGQTLLRNSLPGQWSKRLAPIAPETDGEYVVYAQLAGNPCAVTLGEPSVEPYRVDLPQFKPYPEVFTEAQARSSVANRPRPDARVKNHRGHPALFINGKPQPDLMYKGINATAKYGDYAAFAEQGIQLATISIATGDTTTPNQCDTESVWLGRDRFAFDRIDDALLRALRRNTNAQLILDIRINPYKSWGTEHPDDVVRNAQGAGAYAPCDYVGKYTTNAALVDPPDSGKWWYPSWQSEAWRSDLEALFTRIGSHVKQSSLGNAVVGFFITGNDDGQFVVHYHDHSAPTQTAFRDFLRKKHGSIHALNASWKTEYQSFDHIVVPQQEWRSDITHYAPGPVPEFRTFKDQDTWGLRDRLARALKRAMDRPVVVMTYAAPYHHAFARTRFVDAVGMQPDYAHRRNGFPIGFYPVSANVVGRKLLFTELDLRSNTGEAWASSEVFREWTSVPETAAEWREIHRKVAGFSIACDYADWYYDMGQYFNDPDVHREIGEVARIRRQLLQAPRSKFRPDVCAVITENERDYLAPDQAVVPHDYVNFNPQWMALASSGVPYERHFLKDILKRPDLQNFKVYLFLHNAFISEHEREMIRRKLLNNNRTIVWVYNSGFISEKGRCVHAMSRLTGITLEVEDTPTRCTMVLQCEGLKPFASGSELYFRTVPWRGRGVASFQVNDGQAAPLARYAETGQVAAAKKRQAQWTSIYIGAAQGLTDDLLNHIAREAGAYVAGPPGHQLHLNGNFASLHALLAGRYRLKLPPGRRLVTDAASGQVLSRASDEFAMDVQPQKTYWFIFR